VAVARDQSDAEANGAVARDPCHVQYGSTRATPEAAVSVARCTMGQVTLVILELQRKNMADKYKVID
jgi:hypothetical protein